DEWESARAFLRERLEEIDGVEVDVDEAGNLWAALPGETGERAVVGSHLDSVPHGGWLDGALGVMAALEVLRACAGSKPRRTPVLVDWADEEGARFGRSLFGSSAVAGTLDLDEVRGLKDAEGRARAEVLVDLRHAEAEPLAAMLEQTRRAAADSGCPVTEEQIWRIEPIPFDQRLVRAAGAQRVLASGALHDAAQMALHVPTAMLFA